MQTSVIARSAAAKSGQQGLDINQEVIGQGLSNIVGSFLSCFPSCGSFNRSAANLETGAKTPFVGLVSAFSLALLVFFAAPVIAYLPVPVMAGVLFLVGAALVKVKDIKHLLSIKGGGRWVFLLVLAATLGSGVDDGVYLGIFLSIAGFLRGVSRPGFELLFEQERLQYLSPGMGLDNTTAVSLSGSLFFGSAQNIERSFMRLANDDHRKAHLILVGEHLSTIDPAAAEIIAQEALRRKASGFQTTLWLRDETILLPQSEMILENALGRTNIFGKGLNRPDWSKGTPNRRASDRAAPGQIPAGERII